MGRILSAIHAALLSIFDKSSILSGESASAIEWDRFQTAVREARAKARQRHAATNHINKRQQQVVHAALASKGPSA